MTTIELATQELTPQNAAPYGQLIHTSTGEPTFSSDEFEYWDELAVDEAGGAISVGVVHAYPQRLVATTFERHLRTGELLAPLDGDVILVLGRPTSGARPETDQVEAFRLRAGTAILLHRGVWHYAPMVSQKSAKVLVVFRKGTSEDDKELRNLDSEPGVRFVVAP